jgi:peroxiredoxin
MKRLFWALPLILVISCSRGKVTEISGTVLDGQDLIIYLDQQGVSEIIAVDSAKIKTDGRFKLKDRIEQPTFYNLHLGNQRIIPLLIKPGDHLEVNANALNFNLEYSLSGSTESQDILDLNLRLSRTKSEMDSLQKIFDESSDADDDFLADIDEKYKEIIDDQRKYSIGFILDNMTSMSSIYALYQKFDEDYYVLSENRDIQMLKITANALDTIYPESEHVQALKRNAAQLEDGLYSRRLQNLMSQAESTIPEILLPNPNGDSLSLSSLMGQVVLLSFWASWDETSVSHNLQLKNLYEKYHDQGFEIYQVSMDNELDNWINAIQYDEIPWINVSELSYPESSVAVKYNIDALPATFLISREGSIVRKNPTLPELNIMVPNLLN